MPAVVPAARTARTARPPVKPFNLIILKVPRFRSQKMHIASINAAPGKERQLGHDIKRGRRAAYCARVMLLLATPAAHALELTHAGVIEIDWTRTTVRTDGQRIFESEPSVGGLLELGLSARISPAWHADLVLLAEDIGVTDRHDYLPAEGATDKRPDRPHVEEFTLGYTTESFDAAAGRMAVPFGRFETMFLSDPLTLEVGETMTEAGARAAYGWGDWQFGTAVYGGNLRSNAPETSGYSVSLGWDDRIRYVSLGYLSDQYAADRAPGLIDVALGLSGEQVAARLEFTGAPTAEYGLRPQALHAELAWQARAAWELGLRYQQTSGFPVLEGGDGSFRGWAGGMNHALSERIGMGLEHAVGREGGARLHATLARLTLTF
jgi:hypothetical protein